MERITPSEKAARDAAAPAPGARALAEQPILALARLLARIAARQMMNSAEPPVKEGD